VGDENNGAGHGGMSGGEGVMVKTRKYGRGSLVMTASRTNMDRIAS